MADIPLFPLPATIVFPGMTVPLYIFEERYKTMVKDILKKDEPRFVIALAKEKVDINDSRSIAHGVGTFVNILRIERNADDTMNILVHGQERCWVREINTQQHSYYSMPAQPYVLERGDLNLEKVIAWDTINVFQDYAQAFYPTQVQEQIDQAMPDTLLFQASFICANLHLHSGQKQALLEAISLHKRFELAQEMMKDQLEAYTAFEDKNGTLLEDIVRTILKNSLPSNA